MLGWLVANDDRGDPTRASIMTVRAAVGPLLAQAGGIADPEARTDVAKEIKILFVILHAGWRSAMAEGKAEQYADGVARMFTSATGDDMRELVLTDRGFRPRA